MSPATERSSWAAPCMFGGRVPTDPSNFIERTMLKNTPRERRDARDWVAIEAWGRSVAEELGATVPARVASR
jgi:hypothetical protein